MPGHGVARSDSLNSNGSSVCLSDRLNAAAGYDDWGPARGLSDPDTGLISNRDALVPARRDSGWSPCPYHQRVVTVTASECNTTKFRARAQARANCTVTLRYSAAVRRLRWGAVRCRAKLALPTSSGSALRRWQLDSAVSSWRRSRGKPEELTRRETSGSLGRSRSSMHV